jgi:hypothetical protein
MDFSSVLTELGTAATEVLTLVPGGIAIAGAIAAVYFGAKMLRRMVS